MSWSSRALKCVKRLQNTDSCANFVPFIVDDIMSGMIHKNNMKYFRQSEYFCIDNSSVRFVKTLITSSQKTEALHNFFSKLKNEGKCLHTLNGWRNETYSVFRDGFMSSLLFDVERAAVPLLGCKSYGVHLNGYSVINGEYKIWLGIRGKDKPKYPGMYDNIVAGGISSGFNIWDTLVKEADEEANMTPELIARAKPAGCICYTITNEYGTSPEVEFVYDIELPSSYNPANNDGEVDNFQLLSVEEVKEVVVGNDFKPNCAGITIDFLIRHGLIHPDDTPDYVEIVNTLHSRYLF